MAKQKQLATMTMMALCVITQSGCDSETSSSTDQGLTASASCAITKANGIATITCPDGSSATLSDGAQGVGSGISSQSIPSGDSRCPQGNGGVEYQTFIDANNTGILAAGDTITSTNYVCNGATGATGAAGASSEVSVTTATSTECPTGGWLINVTNGSTTLPGVPVCNGATGATGPAGARGPAGTTPSGLTIAQFIAPCGNGSSAEKEQLIQLSDGSLLSDFSLTINGMDTRLTILPDGTYEDTDESGCHFTVGTCGKTRTLSWSAGSSSADPSGWAAGKVSWQVL